MPRPAVRLTVAGALVLAAGLALAQTPPTSAPSDETLETALREEVPGAALVTLAAAFSQTGSQSIVASLWKVSDVATRDFMVAFHRPCPRPAGPVRSRRLS